MRTGRRSAAVYVGLADETDDERAERERQAAGRPLHRLAVDPLIAGVVAGLLSWLAFPGEGLGSAIVFGAGLTVFRLVFALCEGRASRAP